MHCSIFSVNVLNVYIILDIVTVLSDKVHSGVED